jgi:hypothetical protein
MNVYDWANLPEDIKGTEISRQASVEVNAGRAINVYQVSVI